MTKDSNTSIYVDGNKTAQDVHVQLMTDGFPVTEKLLWDAIKFRKDDVSFTVSQHPLVTAEMLNAIIESPEALHVAMSGVLTNPLATQKMANKIWEAPHLSYKSAVLLSDFVDVKILWEGLNFDNDYIRLQTSQAFNKLNDPKNILFKQLLVYGLNKNGITEANITMPKAWLVELARTIGFNLIF